MVKDLFRSCLSRISHACQRSVDQRIVQSELFGGTDNMTSRQELAREAHALSAHRRQDQLRAAHCRCESHRGHKGQGARNEGRKRGRTSGISSSLSLCAPQPAYTRLRRNGFRPLRTNARQRRSANDTRRWRSRCTGSVSSGSRGGKRGTRCSSRDACGHGSIAGHRGRSRCASMGRLSGSKDTTNTHIYVCLYSSSLPSSSSESYS